MRDAVRTVSPRGRSTTWCGHWARTSASAGPRCPAPAPTATATPTTAARQNTLPGGPCGGTA